MESQPPQPVGRVLRLAQVELRTIDWAWSFKHAHAEAIAEDWSRRLAASPAMFNGPVYLMHDFAIGSGRLFGTLFKTDFMSFVYWRDRRDEAVDDVRELFGVSIIRSIEGHVLLGRQAAGNLNAGRVYPPCGVIDDGDVRAGSIDIDASVTRELEEETGLGSRKLHRLPGYLVAMVGRQVAVAVEWKSDRAAEELRKDVLATVRAQSPPELDDIVIVRREADIDADRTPAFARALLRHVLSA